MSGWTKVTVKNTDNNIKVTNAFELYSQADQSGVIVSGFFEFAWSSDAGGGVWWKPQLITAVSKTLQQLPLWIVSDHSLNVE